MTTINDIPELFNQLVSGDRAALGRAITLVESKNQAHRKSATTLLDLCLAKKKETFRFAVSGAPGAGKSTFIETLGKHIVEKGQSLAILTIDPSSQISGGSILGDKTRMTTLSHHDQVFIRPTAAGDALGGVADATREAIALCEAAGYQNICIETVGVGQSEVAAKSMTDFLLLLVLPGGGDDLQGIKRGIVEIADAIAINKADGDQKDTANITRQNYKQAAHFFALKTHGIPTQVVSCSALEDTGIGAIWTLMQDFKQQINASGYIDTQRTLQDVDWLESKIDRLVLQLITQNSMLDELYDNLKTQVSRRQMSVSSAYENLSKELQSILNKQQA